MLAAQSLALSLLAGLVACAPVTVARAPEPRPAPSETENTTTRRPAERPSHAGDLPADAPSIDPKDIAIFWPLGSSSRAGATNPLNQGFGVHAPGGFDKWIDQWIKPVYAKGFRKLIIHNPLGNDPGSSSMDLDQAYDAHDKGRDWNIREFDAALRRIGREMPGMTVIVYIGTRETDLSAALKDGRLHDHFVRASSLFLLTDILDHEHVTLAFDAASNYEDDSPERYLVDMVRAYKKRQGHDVYVEPIPQRGWEQGYSWIALERYYTKHTGRAARQSPADAIRIFNTPGDFAAWDGDGWAWIADCLRQGHTPALGWNLDDQKASPWPNMSAASIAARANALAARPARRP